MSRAGSLGEALRALRHESGQTIEGLAERSGVSVRSIGGIERGVIARPQRRTIEALLGGLRATEEQRAGVLRMLRPVTDGRQAAHLAPHRVSDFVGRESELSEMLDLAAPGGSPRIVVVSGGPGLGKTTLAMEVAHRIAAHVEVRLFVDLEGLAAVPLTPLGVLQTLIRQITEGTRDVPTSLDAAAAAWGRLTAGRSVAVVLDNAGYEDQVRAVVSPLERGTVVVTSRRSLAGLEAARRFVLAPLGLSESTTLLERIIPPAQRDAAGLDELVALAAHVPLALRVIGNRIASRPAETTASLARRLRDENRTLRLLVAGDLAVESAFALSYQDLRPEAAEVFRALAVIDGRSFQARIAAAVLDREAAVTEDLLEELTSLGLLEHRGGDRYRLHDLMRLFAATRQADQDGVEVEAQRRARLRGWLLNATERAGAWFEPGRDPARPVGGVAFADQDAARAWLVDEVDHWWPAYRAAAVAGEHSAVTDVADALHWFSDQWMSWGHWHELYTLAEAAADALDDDHLRATHGNYVSWAELAERNDLDAAAAAVARALAAATRAHDETQIGWAHLYASWPLRRVGRWSEALLHSQTAIDAFHRSGDHDGLHHALSDALGAEFALGLLEEGLAHAKVLLTDLRTPAGRFEGHIDQWLASETLRNMAQALNAHARFDEAYQAAQEAIDTATEFGWANGIARGLHQRALARHGQADVPGALDDLAAALRALGPESPDKHAETTRQRVQDLLDTWSSPTADEASGLEG